MDIIIRAARAEDAVDLSALAKRSKASWNYPAAWLKEWHPQLSFPQSISPKIWRMSQSGRATP